MEHEANRRKLGARLPLWSRHLAAVFQEVGDRNEFKLAARTLAGEVLDTTNDVSAIFRALDDHLDTGFEFGCVTGVTPEELGAPENSGERVVDVVGDAEGELTECGHLLGVNLLLALCDVIP